MVRLDIHVHTSPGSRCSTMEHAFFLKAAAELGLKTVCVTNHGDVEDFTRLALTAPAGLALIPGVEISSEEGDFLIFSTDFGFLRSLKPIQALPPRHARPEQTAVVWAHPFAGIPGAAGVEAAYLSRIARQVDGIEVFNGNWPDPEASSRARRLARDFDLAELGGSDAHEPGRLLGCWTEIGAASKTEDLITAIRERKTKAGCRQSTTFGNHLFADAS